MNRLNRLKRLRKVRKQKTHSLKKYNVVKKEKSSIIQCLEKNEIIIVQPSALSVPERKIKLKNILLGFIITIIPSFKGLTQQSKISKGKSTKKQILIQKTPTNFFSHILAYLKMVLLLISYALPLYPMQQLANHYLSLIHHYTGPTQDQIYAIELLCITHSNFWVYILMSIYSRDDNQKTNLAQRQNLIHLKFYQQPKFWKSANYNLRKIQKDKEKQEILKPNKVYHQKHINASKISNICNNNLLMIFYRLPNRIVSTVLHSIIKCNKFMKSSEPPNRDGSDQNNIESKLEINKNQNLQIMVKAILQERRFYKQIEQQRWRKEQEERRQRQAKEQQRLRKEQEERRQRQAKEQQRWRKEQEERRQRQAREQQRQVKEQQKQAKKQQRLRKEQEKTKKAQKFKFIISSFISISSLSLAIAYYFFDFDPIERSRQNNMVRKCFNFPFEQNKYVDSPLYSQAKKVIQLSLQGRIMIVAGCSGIGKTTVVKRILKDMQKQGEQTYYFSFEEFYNDQDKDRLKKQFYLFIRGLKRRYKNENRAKIIFDHIDRVEEYPQEFKYIMADIYGLSPYPNLNVTCISSSGSFLQNQINHKYWGALFKKMGKAKILQDFLLDNEDMKKFHIEIMKMKFKNNYKDSQKILAFEQSTIPQKIADMKITTRDLVKTFSECLALKKLDFSKKENLEKIIQYFKLKQIDQLGMLYKKIAQSKPDRLKFETYVSLLKIMNSLKKKELDFNTCAKILKKIKYDDQYKIASHALDVLEENNLIILCRPRSETEAQAFNKFIESHQNKKNIEKSN